jgi:UDP-N-acetylmuramate dehydrogenase
VIGDEGIAGARGPTASGPPDTLTPLLGELSSLGVSSQPGERLARHTSFKIGGPAGAFVEPVREADAIVALTAAAARGVPVLMVGLGSNLLVSDHGFAGLVVSLARACRTVAVEGERLRAGAGVSLAKAAHVAESQGLTGLEFAVSIPGTVGGAVVMNAGAHGRSTADAVVAVRVFDPRSGVMTLPRAELAYAYRYSRAQTEPWVVLEALFQLRAASVAQVRDTMRGYMEHRRKTQPVGEKNAGSMFKNPPGAFAAALIEAVGAKGWRCGGAEVSSLHANFIANDGTATARDVLDLMRRVRSAVRDRFGILLRPEVRWVGPSEGEDGTTWDDLWLKADDG